MRTQGHLRDFDRRDFIDFEAGGAGMLDMRETRDKWDTEGYHLH